MGEARPKAERQQGGRQEAEAGREATRGTRAGRDRGGREICGSWHVGGELCHRGFNPKYATHNPGDATALRRTALRLCLNPARRPGQATSTLRPSSFEDSVRNVSRVLAHDSAALRVSGAPDWLCFIRCL